MENEEVDFWRYVGEDDSKWKPFAEISMEIIVGGKTCLIENQDGTRLTLGPKDLWNEEPEENEEAHIALY
jgi:hypothetical protein